MVCLEIPRSGPRYSAPPVLDLTAELPDELYLRGFMRLDTGSPDEVLEFVSKWGALATRWADVIPPVWIPGAAFLEDYRHLDMLIEAEYPEIRRTQNVERDAPDVSFYGHFLPESFRLKAGLLRDAIRVWLCIKGTLTEPALSDQWESGWAYEFKSVGPATAEFFLPLMSRALSPFAVTLYIAGSEPFGRAEEQRCSTYNLLALQLANDVAQNSEYRVCQEPSCGQVFVRQSGRAVYGQSHTRGVRYCSASCASRASSARHRQRKRLGVNDSTDGGAE